ncbi:signal recognition particle, SRP9/SRP14 subunit [Pseudovirgaria hyperparasitica]|uniref:Signal recognition particle subunit SRP14 n=1 Tax=Pseudovirgaria hyperparasitica TaxID=470096 RepID=A0A6A6WDN6_9PEZI|nr:signal recognition particle, SRP9/SRP14 subunit [Pseudovirgaria hyperparasitica]KAF2760090.1 signal recognition particle, SRP9/SRP14 subunit [Pseudovirgaria hyperparasitica]
MASIHMSNEEFFTRLAELFDSRRNKGHGTVFLTQKRLTYAFDDETDFPPSAEKVSDDPLWDLHPPHPVPVLIRATDGASKEKRRDRKKDDKVKLSTIVQPDALDSFYVRYAEICKTGMSALKKRDRSKRKKVAKKKKAGGVDDGNKA